MFRTNLVVLILCGTVSRARRSLLPQNQGHDETRPSSRACLAIFGPFCVNVRIFMCSSESHAVSLNTSPGQNHHRFQNPVSLSAIPLAGPGQLPGYKFWSSHLFRSPPTLLFLTMAHASQPFQSKFSSAARRRLSSLDNTVRPAAIASLQVGAPTRSLDTVC